MRSYFKANKHYASIFLWLSLRVLACAILAGHHRVGRHGAYFVNETGTDNNSSDGAGSVVITLNGTTRLSCIQVFAELCGVPVMVQRRPYVERMVEFRPFACSDFIIPMLGRLCPPGEKLDRFVCEQSALCRQSGSNKRPRGSPETPHGLPDEHIP